MQTSEMVKAPAAVMRCRALPARVPRWLAGWRGLALLGAALVVGGLYAGWGWLTAVGLAPIILSLAPCAAMCAIGACAMSRGGSGGAKSATEKIEPPASTTADP
ncbi:MAG TPA: hypothetical protein VN681_03055 [Stellaceae bacterium]|nr:hypothetical protein [Stellaceae bacterium]